MFNHRSLSLSTFAMAIMLTVIASTVRATDRYFPDRTVLSANGRYRIEARSPDNAGEHPQPFADHFVYSLYDTQTGNLVWKRAQPDREASPVAIYLHNDAWVTIRTGWDELVVLHPVTAQTVTNVSILDVFSEEEELEHVSDTTAGPMWSGCSRWYYLEQDEDLYFVVRPVWGLRIILDVTRGELLARNDERVVEPCRLAERRFVHETLRSAAANVDTLGANRDYTSVINAETAIIMAAQNRDREVIPFLTILQRSDYAGDSGGWFDFENKIPEGGINPFDSTSMSIRRATHDALRLLGEKPEELPCTWFRYEKTKGLGDYVELAPLPAPRATRVDLVSKGTAPLDVLTAVGSPDYVNHSKRAWEYHMDTGQPYTLLVVYDQDYKVDHVEQHTPPLWLEDGAWLHRLIR